jgi:hypothetical protein
MCVRLIERYIFRQWLVDEFTSNAEAVLNARSTLDIRRETRALIGIVSGTLIAV